MIQRNVELEAKLIDDLLDLTRITRGKLALHFEVADVHGCSSTWWRSAARRRGSKRLEIDARARGRRAPRLGRPGAAAAGVLEPAQERREVHARRRPDRGAHVQPRAGAGSGRR